MVAVPDGASPWGLHYTATHMRLEGLALGVAGERGLAALARPVDEDDRRVSESLLDTGAKEAVVGDSGHAESYLASG